MCEYAKVVNEGNKPSVTMCEVTGNLFRKNGGK